MMLGWGLRGFIGGGPLGAMIPGGMVALAICLTRGIQPSARVCAFGAIAIGFGGDMTYGQTVGAAIDLDTRHWGLLGLTVKGAVWGMLGGAGLSLAFARISPRMMAFIGIVLAVSTWVGWKLINQPKLIYFSNRLDRPREEVWAGLLLAALTLLMWLGATQPHLLRFAAWGTLGGGLGFGLGGAIQAYGIQHFGREYPWWKCMEFTFGLLFGLALSLAARQLPKSYEPNPADAPLWQQILAATFFGLLLLGHLVKVDLRFDFLVMGVFALWLVTLLPWTAWQLGLTITVAATFFDLSKHQHDLAALAASVVFCLVVASYARNAASALILLTWSATAVATAKFIRQWSGPENVICIVFILMAVAVTWMIRRLPMADAP
jgi:hypothetical protein